MKTPEDIRAEIASFPPALRAIVDAELAAGNEVAGLVNGFPVAPRGVGIRFRRPISVPVPSDSSGVWFCRFPGWDGSSGFADASGRSFVLGPPRVPPDPPSMDAIRDAANRPRRRAREAAPGSPLARFERSLQIDFEKWHDGIGYDLDAIREASPEERAEIEALLLRHDARDWRDVEALAALNSPASREALRCAMTSRDCEVALAVARYAPNLLTEAECTALIVRGLECATFFGGLSMALDQAERHHPPQVLDALFSGAVQREANVAAHFAAMLMFLYGQAETSFDMEQRPFFLTFHTSNPAAREAAFRRLCRKIGVEAQPFLGPG